MKLKEIIAVTNDKGGVGKTTTAVNLAVGLTEKKFKVLLIDSDAQGFASLCCQWNPSREKEGEPTMFTSLSTVASLPVYKSSRGVYFTPASPRLSKIDSFLNQQMSPNQVLLDVFSQDLDNRTGEELSETITEAFDYIIIDCPPSMNSLTFNAMSASTGLLIPVQLEAFSVKGLTNVIAVFKQMRRSLNKNLRIRGLLFVMSDERLKINKSYRAGLEEMFSGLIFETQIRRCVKVTEGQNEGKDIFQYARYSNAGLDYARFVKEFLRTSNTLEK